MPSMGGGQKRRAFLSQRGLASPSATVFRPPQQTKPHHRDSSQSRLADGSGANSMWNRERIDRRAATAADFRGDFARWAEATSLGCAPQDSIERRRGIQLFRVAARVGPSAWRAHPWGATRLRPPETRSQGNFSLDVDIGLARRALQAVRRPMSDAEAEAASRQRMEATDALSGEATHSLQWSRRVSCDAGEASCQRADACAEVVPGRLLHAPRWELPGGRLSAMSSRRSIVAAPGGGPNPGTRTRRASPLAGSLRPRQSRQECDGQNMWWCSQSQCRART